MTSVAASAPPDAEPLWRERRGRHRIDVLGIGQNSLDRLCEFRGGLRAGEKRWLPQLRESPGGQVATAVLACARLGLRCGYIGNVGDDAAAPLVLAPLRAAGVDLSGVRVHAGATTQTAVILVDPSQGERSVLWHRPDAIRLVPEQLSRDQIAGIRLLLLDAGDPEAGAWAADIARAAGIPVVLDADAYAPEVEPLLDRVDFPLVSAAFAESYPGGASVEELLGMLRGRGATLAAVTLGQRGVAAAMGDHVFAVPAFKVAALDTTGAGDAFHGGFAWAVLSGWSAAACLRAACAAAALNCRGFGAQGALPDLAELTAMLAAPPGPAREPGSFTQGSSRRGGAR